MLGLYQLRELLFDAERSGERVSELVGHGRSRTHAQFAVVVTVFTHYFEGESIFMQFTPFKEDVTADLIYNYTFYSECDSLYPPVLEGVTVAEFHVLPVV